MKSGKIKYWHDKKGYGFIKVDEGGKDVFFHISSWQGQHRPQINEAVEFMLNPEPEEQNALWTRPKSPPQKPPKKVGWLGKVGAAAMLAAGSLTLWHNNQQPLTDHQPTAIVQSAEDQLIQKTITLIQQGGPFPYAKDGAIFQNREKRLPVKHYGFYHEYTVPTPSAPDRGAKRIVTGGNPPEIYYYTADHYQSFRQLSVPAK